MVRMNEDDAPARERTHDERQGEREATRPLGEHVSEIAGHLARLARIRGARMKLRALTFSVQALAGLVALLTALVLAFSAARLLVRGLSGALEVALGGRPWLAELLAGLVLLAGLAAALTLTLRLGERRILRALGKASDGRS